MQAGQARVSVALTAYIQEIPELMKHSLLRLIVRLPSPLPVYNGMEIKLPTETNAGHNNCVLLRFIEGRTDYGDHEQQSSSLLHYLQLVGLSPEGAGEFNTGVEYRYTIVDAITAFGLSGDSSTLQEYEDARDFPPEVDPINRIVDAIARVSRAFRLATKTRVHVLTYEDLPSVLRVWESSCNSSDWTQLDTSSMDWSVSVLLLENLTYSPDWVDPALSEGGDKTLAAIARHFSDLIDLRDPLALSLEWAVRAKHSLYVRGQYFDATTNAITFVESFVTAFATCLLWEENFKDPKSSTPEDAASFFSFESRSNIVENVLQPRIGGDWSSDNSVWTTWKRGARQLRHRIVHTGYTPTRREASAAVADSMFVQEWILSRASEQLRNYPRTCLITMGDTGLKSRDKWTRFIVNFHEQHASTEPDWRKSHADWHNKVMSLVT